MLGVVLVLVLSAPVGTLIEGWVTRTTEDFVYCAVLCVCVSLTPSLGKVRFVVVGVRLLLLSAVL